jgi:hypothetical protein
MKKYCKLEPTLWLLFVAHARVEAYLSAGWVDCGAPPFPLGLHSRLMEWPVDRGEPVEPPTEEHC